MVIISPAEWGATINYDDWNDEYTPDEGIALHHGGRLNYVAAQKPYNQAKEMAKLRQWEQYHLRKGWRGLAYGWAIGQTGTIYRIRGFNSYGAHLGDIDGDGISNNEEIIPVIWIASGHQHTPTPEFHESMEWLRKNVIEVRSLRATYLWGHKEVQADVSGTACPGPAGMQYVNDHRYVSIVEGTPIMGKSVGTQAQALSWAASRSAHERFLAVIPVYYEIAEELGVRADVAIAQSAKETRYGHFPNVVPASHHNWCGLKITKGGGNKDPDAHAKFSNDRVGVRAHLEHLHLYAKGRVVNTVDPRHFRSIAGVAPSVEALGGWWAKSPTYGTSIVNNFLNPLLAAIPKIFIPKEDDVGMVILSNNDQLDLQLFLRKLDDMNSSIAFVDYLIPWFREWRDFEPADFVGEPEDFPFDERF